jgi:hypothetical protein
MVLPDSVHYLIGLILVAFFVWVIIRLHKHFSKNIVPITSQTLTEQFLSRQAILPGPK